MILWVRDRFKNLSFYHYRMIIVTIFVPVILTVVVTYFAVDYLLVRVIIDVGRSPGLGVVRGGRCRLDGRKGHGRGESVSVPADGPTCGTGS